ncbi:MAG TPA: EamA family transporter [Eoetvoesiella sp.]|uniref:EamA family transporter n=1 Tax=Eoetvoesiella sp. TaxID=1966355 RepID=UPI002BA36F97|nr:EamA family transporter [Eoetvoesiella sp.]HWK60339.1 EamA family transporter [Eoetvoesiella sp.]
MSSSRQTSLWWDVLITSIGPVLWGTTYIVTTEILPPGRPFTAAVLRIVPAGLILILYTRLFPPRKEWGRMLILAALNLGFFQAMLFVAAYRLPGGLASVVGAIQPLLIMGIVWAADRIQPARLALWAAIMGVVGMGALLLSPGSVWDPIGVAAAAAGALSMSFGTCLTRRWSTSLPMLAFTGWQLFIAGLMIAPFALLFDPPLRSVTLLQASGYAYLSLGGALLAYFLWFRGVARLSPVAVSSLNLISPVTAVVLGWALLGQSIKGMSMVGLVAVLASILLVQWASSRRMP